MLCLNVVIFVRTALYLTKFTRIRDWLVRASTFDETKAARAHVVARSIAQAARYVPKATCMTQALSGQAVLSWFGIPSDLVIGAASALTTQACQTDNEGATDFHAWLIWHDKVLLGGEELAQRHFVPLHKFSSHLACP